VFIKSSNGETKMCNKSWWGKAVCGVILPCLMFSAAWGGSTYTYKWSQTACQGAVCGATIDGAWTFQQYAVERGSATYFGLRNEYPQLDKDGVVSFSFTIGAFISNTIKFGPITWPTGAALGGGILQQRGGSYHVQFSADRQSIVGVHETAFSGATTNPVATVFELAPTNPSIRLTVTPKSIGYYQATGSEPFGPDGIPVRPSATLQGQWLLASLTNLVGDKDDFTPGQSADVPSRSARVQDLLRSIACLRRQGLAADLDAGGSNRPVGWTHEFTIPPNARITGGSIKLHVRANSGSGADDFVLYDDSRQKHRDVFAPLIALRDLPPLSGRALRAGEEITLEIDLSSVPVHLKHKLGHKRSRPDEYRNLLPLLEDGRFDTIVGDDLSVDYSELTVSLAAPSPQ
jgi:hypothetical protein